MHPIFDKLREKMENAPKFGAFGCFLKNIV